QGGSVAPRVDARSSRGVTASRSAAAGPVAQGAGVGPLAGTHLVLGVFSRAAAYLVGRVAPLILHDLVGGRAEQIKPQLVGEPYEVNQHVGGLGAHARELPLVRCRT